MYFVITHLMRTSCFSNNLVTSLPLPLKYLGIGKRTKLVNVGNHFSHIFSLFVSYMSRDFVSGIVIDSRQNILVIICI